MRDGDNRYSIEEFINGADMSKALLQKTKFLDPSLYGKFPPSRQRRAAAHHAGVVHLDLKPTNVIVTSGYSLTELKVTDFGGIAKMAAEELMQPLTMQP